MKIYRFARLFAVLLVLVAGLLVTSPTHAQGRTVVVEAADGNVFRPATITINVGDTVTWRNTDDVPHTSTSEDDVWDSGSLGAGEEFSFTFEEAGTFPYFCEFHPGMEGTVVVQEAQQEAEPTAAVEPTETTQAEPTAAAEPTEATQAEPTVAAEPTAEMPEHTPNTGAGGTTGSFLPMAAIAALFSLLVASVYGLSRSRRQN
jgi:plastocyanin